MSCLYPWGHFTVSVYSLLLAIESPQSHIHNEHVALLHQNVRLIGRLSINRRKTRLQLGHPARMGLFLGTPGRSRLVCLLLPRGSLRGLRLILVLSLVLRRVGVRRVRSGCGRRRSRCFRLTRPTRNLTQQCRRTAGREVPVAPTCRQLNSQRGGGQYLS